MKIKFIMIIKIVKIVLLAYIKDKKNINQRIHNKRIDYITSLIKETLKKYKIGDMIL